MLMATLVLIRHRSTDAAQPERPGQHSHYRPSHERPPFAHKIRTENAWEYSRRVTMRRRKWSSCCADARHRWSLVAALMIVGVAGPARADGAFPDSLQILLPADRPNVIGLATNFGVILSEDAGRT